MSNYRNTANYNHALARKYFIEKGMMPEKSTERWVLHHINPDWEHNDPERYNQWNPEDLIPMTQKEHRQLHMRLAVERGDTAKYNSWDKHSDEQKDKFRYSNKGVHKSEETKLKISLGSKGKHNHKGELNPNFGKKRPGVGGRKKGAPPTKGTTGMHWYNNGTNNVTAYECPEGYVKGRLGCYNPHRDEFGRFAHANTEVKQEIA